MHKGDNNQHARCSDPGDPYSGRSFDELEDMEVDNSLETREGATLLTTKKRTYHPCNGQVTRNHNIEVDRDEVVEVEELQENGPPRIGIMGRVILAHHVWLLPPGQRIIVHLDEVDQPMRKGGLAFMHFLSDISRDGCNCPIGDTS